MSSSTRTLTYGELSHVLSQLGFEAEQVRPEYLVFRHAHPAVLIVLPARRPGDPVDAAHLLAVRTHLLENGLLSEASFERMLRDSEPTVASQ